MFAYCGNNPVKYSDPSGYMVSNSITNPNAMLHGGYGQIDVFMPGQDPYKGLVMIGLTGSAYCGPGLEASTCAVFGGKGDFAIVTTYAAGAGTPSYGAGVILAYSSAPETQKLKGHSGVVGTSVSIWGISVGIEYSITKDTDTNETYHGYSLFIGGGSPISFENHGGVAYTEVREIWAPG